MKGNLLDVVLTDVEGMCAVQVLPPVADHCLVQVVVDVQTLQSVQVDRQVWDWKSANWPGQRSALSQVNWNEIFNLDDAHDVTEKFTETILRQAKQFISYRSARFHKSSHPWMNGKACDALDGCDGCDARDDSAVRRFDGWGEFDACDGCDGCDARDASAAGRAWCADSSETPAFPIRHPQSVHADRKGV